MLHVNQLIIIGGPSCAGKTTLIKKIRKGTLPDLCEQIGITTPSLWRYASAKDLIESRESLIERVVVHYDIYARYSQKKEFNYLSELVNNSDSVIILTLYVPPEIFVKRISSRIHITLKSLLSLGLYKGAGLLESWRRIMPQLKKRKEYKEGYSMFLYKKWFIFFGQNGVTTHWILDSSKPNIAVADLYEIDSRDLSDGVYELIHALEAEYPHR